MGHKPTYGIAAMQHVHRRGFDFLGYHFSPAGLSVAKQTEGRAAN